MIVQPRVHPFGLSLKTIDFKTFIYLSYWADREIIGACYFSPLSNIGGFTPASFFWFFQCWPSTLGFIIKRLTKFHSRKLRFGLRSGSVWPLSLTTFSIF